MGHGFIIKLVCTPSATAMCQVFCEWPWNCWILQDMEPPEQTNGNAVPTANSRVERAELPSWQATSRVPVSIAMCTYQGGRHIEQQLQSILEQSWPVRLHVADDASSDETIARVQKYLRADVDSLDAHDVNVGYVKNFERTLSSLVDSGAPYIALADQDDVWELDRIAKGMQSMQRLESEYGENVPLLVHSDLRLIDDEGGALHPSFLNFRRYRIQAHKQLRVVLGENGVMGNTILMNHALAKLALPFPPGLHVHDYWLALLAELFGQRDMLTEPQVNYRLHQSNASNTANSMLPVQRIALYPGVLKRCLSLDFKLPFKEDSRVQVLRHLLSVEHAYPELTEQERQDLQEFERYLSFEQSRLRSLVYLLSSGVARRGLRYRLRLCLATLLTRRYRGQGRD